MEQDKISAEAKAVIKFAGKFLDKINPYSPYQEKLKRDIEYINRSLEFRNLEQLIRCNLLIAKEYSYVLSLYGFYEVDENEIRKKGYSWNYGILNKARSCLQQELSNISTLSSAEEVLHEYVSDKISEDK